MSLYSLALFIHVSSDIALITGIGVWLLGLIALRRADRVEQVRTIAGLMFLTDRMYGLAGVLLLSSGVYMTSAVWGWDTAWIGVALATLFLVLPLAPLFVERRIKTIAHAAAELADGPLPESLALRIHDPALMAAHLVVTMAVLGIIFLMTVKPPLTSAILAAVLFVLLGAAMGVPLWRSARARAHQG